MTKTTRLQVTFRSGAQIECDVVAYTFEKQYGVTHFKWSTPAHPRRELAVIDASEICSIVVIK